MKRQLNRGQLVSQKRLQEIAENYNVRQHTLERIAERHPNLDIKSTILNPVLAYYNTDGSINIALNEWEYLVVVRENHKYQIITFKEKSHNNINIFEKRKMAQDGYARAEKKQYTMRWENKQNKTI